MVSKSARPSKEEEKEEAKPAAKQTKEQPKQAKPAPAGPHPLTGDDEDVGPDR